MPARRYNCRCGKTRYRDERAALAAAAADRERFGDEVTVYRCPGGLAWHLTAHGFTPQALRSTGRRLAYALLDQGRVELDEWAGHQRRARQCAEQMTELGLTRQPAPGQLETVDRDGLARVVRIGLDAYAAER